MLNADKSALRHGVQKLSLDIYNKELGFFSRSSVAVASQGALLVGISYYGMVDMKMDLSYDITEPKQIIKGLFYIFSTLSLCLEIWVLAFTVLMTVMGENKALRGPDGSMAPSVEGMREERKYIFIIFACGMGNFLIALIFLSWVKFKSELASSVATVAIVALIVGLSYKSFKVLQLFEVPDEVVVSGKMEDDGIVRVIN